MQETDPKGVTDLLIEWREGSSEALEELIPVIYEELHRLAHHYMRKESADHVLQSTALINEAYIRLVGMKMDWQSRGHFFAVSAQVMRRVLVDYARRNKAAKRGGPVPALSLQQVELSEPPGTEMLVLDDALRELEAFDPRKSKVLELRVFAGLTIAETAAVLEVSKVTVERDLKMAKAWLSREIRHHSRDSDPSPP